MYNIFIILKREVCVIILKAKTLGTLRKRELRFSEIKYSLFSDSIFTLDSNKPINQ